MDSFETETDFLTVRLNINGYTGTFSVDISTVEDVYKDFGSEGSDKEGEDFFNNNPYIDKIVFPSSADENEDMVKLVVGSITNCKNLTTVIIGSVDDPSTKFDTIEEGVFVNCPNLTTIIVYSTQDVELKGTAGKITSTNTTEKKSIVGGSGTMYLWGAVPDDYGTSYYTVSSN